MDFPHNTADINFVDDDALDNLSKYYGFESVLDPHEKSLLFDEVSETNLDCQDEQPVSESNSNHRNDGGTFLDSPRDDPQGDLTGIRTTSPDPDMNMVSRNYICGPAIRRKSGLAVDLDEIPDECLRARLIRNRASAERSRQRQRRESETSTAIIVRFEAECAVLMEENRDLRRELETVQVGTCFTVIQIANIHFPKPWRTLISTLRRDSLSLHPQ